MKMKSKEEIEKGFDLTGYEEIGYFGNCVIYSKDKHRILIDVFSGKLAFEYNIDDDNESKTV